jgi:hypothetical protein
LESIQLSWTVVDILHVLNQVWIAYERRSSSKLGSRLPMDIICHIDKRTTGRFSSVAMMKK